MTPYLWKDEGVKANKKAINFLKTEYHPNNIKKITVIRHAALGDMIIFRSFIVELKAFFPNAHITLALDSKSKAGAPTDLVDSLFYIYGEEETKKTLARYKNLKTLAPQDIIFDLSSTSRSQLLTLLNKAKLKIGFPHRFLVRAIYDICVSRNVYKFEAESLLDQLNVIGCFPPEKLDFAIPYSTQKQSKVSFFTGASNLGKCYPIDSYRESITLLAKLYPSITFELMEGVNDNESVEAWLDLINEHENITYRKKSSLSSLIDYIANEPMLVISNDTGVRNVAISTHTPTLGLFFSTLPQRYLPSYEKHYICYNPNRSIPTPEQVVEKFNSIIKEMGK